MSPAIVEFAAIEAHRLRQVNARLIFALQIARAALDDALQAQASEDLAYCPRCESIVHTIDDGETCANCKLVL